MGRLDLEKQKLDFIGSYGDKFHSANATKQSVMRADEEEPMSDFDFWRRLIVFSLIDKANQIYILQLC